MHRLFFFTLIISFHLSAQDTLMHVNVNPDSLKLGGYMDAFGISMEKYIIPDPAAYNVAIDKRTKQVFTGICYQLGPHNVIVCWVYKGGTVTEKSEWYTNGNRKALYENFREVKSWYPDGSLEKEYKTAKKDYITREYYDKGGLKSITISAKHQYGFHQSVHTWYENGKQQSKTKAHSPVRSKTKAWYESGRRKSVTKRGRSVFRSSRKILKEYPDKIHLKKETWTISHTKTKGDIRTTKTFIIREKGKLKLRREKSGINIFP